mmetsp:Transcript_6956/g.17029  ORF Transcript_6956/g.17029 Transcript_6956/m.17029 type:complete len:307 (+) Transcript_6956:84-1004(+)
MGVRVKRVSRLRPMPAASGKLASRAPRSNVAMGSFVGSTRSRRLIASVHSLLLEGGPRDEPRGRSDDGHEQRGEGDRKGLVLEAASGRVLRHEDRAQDGHDEQIDGGHGHEPGPRDELLVAGNRGGDVASDEAGRERDGEGDQREPGARDPVLEDVAAEEPEVLLDLRLGADRPGHEVGTQREEAEAEGCEQEGSGRKSLAAAGGGRQKRDVRGHDDEAVPDGEPELVDALRAGEGLGDEGVEQLVVGDASRRARGEVEGPDHQGRPHGHRDEVLGFQRSRFGFLDDGRNLGDRFLLFLKRIEHVE